jgi:mono/diheme cytochrome c family protein
VNNALDQCPSTPTGATVNAQGCAPAQLDSDNDGVNNAIDQCPSTPTGATVNAQGCAPAQLDSDNDGVNNAIDQCPSTPTGATVNAQGCAPAQLDSDNDGVNNALDQCPSTPTGATVNAQGCAPAQLDSDNDGVNNALDQCPSTPTGATVNAQGCAPAQLDSDNDGVNNAIDQCPSTPANETANASGCSLSQLTGDAVAGEALYSSMTCVGCHGANRQGGVGPTLTKAALTAKYSSPAEVQPLVKGMSRYGANATDQQALDIATYLMTVEPAPVGNAANGAALYSSKTCVGCHGASGAGTPPVFPSVRGATAADLSSAIMVSGSTMSAIGAGLTPTEIQDLGAYMSGL